MNKRIQCVLLICCLVFAAVAFLGNRLLASDTGSTSSDTHAEETQAGPMCQTHLTQAGAGIAHVLPPLNLRAVPGHGRLEALLPGEGSQTDLRSADLRHLDLSERRAELERADFDSKTQWPAVMPEGFDPGAIMELGKNPGLGLRALHATGVTGRGVSIAIIDTGLLVDHEEYRERLKLYEEIHCGDYHADPHASAVASIAVGKSVGVAPGADLYYVAETHVRDDMPEAENVDPGAHLDFGVTAKSIRRLLEINRGLPKEQRIRVISIQAGWEPGGTGYEEVTAAVNEAKAEGVFVISSALRRTHGLGFHGLGREPLNDPGNPASYHLITGWGWGFAEPAILVPMDSRTTASPTGASDYVFYRRGGWSWVEPYLAGLYALACQVRPDMTPELFWQEALETGTICDSSEARPIPRAVQADRGVVRSRMASRFDAMAGAFRERASAEALRQTLMAKYQEATGKPAPEVSDAELRDMMIELMTDQEIRRPAAPAAPAPTEVKAARVVNPRALIEALQAPEGAATRH